jgi:hypothetical protein
MKRRNDQFNTSLALIPRSREHIAVILSCEMRPQQSDGRQGNLATFEEPQDDRVVTRRTRSFDASIRRMLGQMEHVGAVHKQRRESFLEVQSSRIDLHQQRDELSGRASLIVRGPLCLCEEIRIGKLRES